MLLSFLVVARLQTRVFLFSCRGRFLKRSANFGTTATAWVQRRSSDRHLPLHDFRLLFRGTAIPGCALGVCSGGSSDPCLSLGVVAGASGSVFEPGSWVSLLRALCVLSSASSV